MTVKTYHLRIFHMGHQKAQWTTQLDLGDEARLREVFVAAADNANRTTRVHNYAQWRLDIHQITEHRPDLRGRLLLQVSVDGAGRTEVTRR